MTRRGSIAIVLLAALAGCRHYHRDTNAPGLVDVRVPPSQPARGELEVPGDPGERMIVLSPGVVATAGGRSRAPHFAGDIAAEVTLSSGESDRSHNDNQAPFLFMPRGLVLPQRGHGVTLGWSALRIHDHPGGGGDLTTGPLYLTLHAFRFAYGGGGGYLYDPIHHDHGAEIFGYLGLVEARARYLLDGGFEVTLGYQFKLPVSWVESR
jgi:hypothetical protein